MTKGSEHIDFARNDESFATEIENEYSDQNHWVVTINFYSLLHYIEQELEAHGNGAYSHDSRKEHIKESKRIDNRVRTFYRRLEDLSRDARYELVDITDEDVEYSKETLAEAKRVMGYSSGGQDSTKYSV